jgi:zinc transport system ATP-binding protein
MYKPIINLTGVDHNQNIIEINNTSFSYEDGNNVLENVSLNIHKGDYIGFVGPNGSGKTTLIKIILGLLKPKNGEIKIFGDDLQNFKDWYRVGYVPQKIGNFDKNFPMTVQEVVAMGRYRKSSFWKKNNSEDKEIIKETLGKVEMWEFRDRLVGDLSGGQLQRVFIARALANEPEVIFLDEPTTGVDKKNQDEFYALLQKLNTEMGITLVIVSHDIERLTQEVMHIVCINKTLTCHTTPEDFIKESQSVNFFGEDVKIITHHNHK